MYVSPDGDDWSGQGLPGAPWRSIMRAMEAASHYAEELHRVTVHLAEGTYESEPVVLTPHVTLQGALADDPGATVIRWFGGADDNTVVQAAENAKLENVRVTLPSGPISSVATLVCINNVAMEIANVILRWRLQAELHGRPRLRRGFVRLRAARLTCGMRQ